jgi:hypothetical protein
MTLSTGAAIAIIYGACALGVVWAIYHYFAVTGIEVKQGGDGSIAAESLKEKNIDVMAV